MFTRILQPMVLVGGALLAFGGSASAAPYSFRPIPPVIRPVAFPIAPANFYPAVMPGSDPRTWSPYPLYPTPNTWARPTYDYGPIPYWLQNPNWRSTMPSPAPNPYPYYPVYGNVMDPYGVGSAGPGSFNLFR